MSVIKMEMDSLAEALFDDILTTLREEDRNPKRATGILVCDIDTDESDLVKECFRSGLSVAVEPVRFDPEVPRLEVGNITVVGTQAIKYFLVTR